MKLNNLLFVRWERVNKDNGLEESGACEPCFTEAGNAFRFIGRLAKEVESEWQRDAADKGSVEMSTNGLDYAEVKDRESGMVERYYVCGGWIDTEVGQTMDGRARTLPEIANEEMLTSLQVITLNAMACDIFNGREDYFSVEDGLSEGEDRYLRENLEQGYRILVLKGEGVALRGKAREDWLEAHKPLAV